MDIIRFGRLPVPPLERWRKDSAAQPSRHWEKLSADAEGARSLTLLVMPYRPYLPTAEGVELSAFYVASNALHAACAGQGTALPVKPVISGYGIGAYGRNGITAIPGAGTYFAAALIASDEEPDMAWEWREDRPLSLECSFCRACVEACPNSALTGDGRLDVGRCLRAQAQFQTPPMPHASRELIGASAWGCDICQQLCRRNAGIENEPMPRQLAEALELSRLLRGDVKQLGGWIGTNYARPARMQARGCLVAANMRRSDLLPDIRALLQSPVEAVRDCAAWAMEKLENGGE